MINVKKLNFMQQYKFLLVIMGAFIFVSAFHYQSTAQDHTLYRMDKIPQSLEYNPALTPQANGYLNIPVLSSVKFNMHNTGFAYWDAIHFGSGTRSDSLILDLNGLKETLADRNYLRSEFSTNILGFGFKVGYNYFTFNITTKFQARLGYPKDLIGIKDGNYDPVTKDTKDIEFSGAGLKITGYNELAVGYSRQIMPDLRVGGRLKGLSGIANIYTSKTNINLKTDNETYDMTATANIESNIAFPMDITHDDQGDIDNIEPASPDVKNDLLLNGNGGFAVDLGGIYEYNDSLSFSMSIIDLGFIKWKNNVHEISSEGTFEFEGIDTSPDEKGDIVFYDSATELGDSIRDAFTLSDTSGQAYTSPLTTKIYLNANYQITEMISLSALNKNLLYDGAIHPQLTLGARADVTDYFSAKLTYSMMDRSYNNFGLGLSVSPGPVQLYIVSDNISAAFWPHNARSVSFRFGLNFLFGTQDEQIDQSLVE